MSEWTIEFDGWRPDDEPLRESLAALGNGYVVTRGAAEEYAAGGAHYPGTYLAGGYDRDAGPLAHPAGHHADDAPAEQLVNWPNWLPLTFRPDRPDGLWLDPDRWTILEHRRTLDLQRGLLVRRMRVRDPAGRVTALRSRRLVHMGEPHMLAMEWELTPENWSGPLVVRTALDGTVENGAARADGIRGREHLLPLDARHDADAGVVELLVEARQSGLRVAMAARTTCSVDDRGLGVERTPDVQEGYAAEELRLSTGPGRTVRVEKIVALCTSRDRGIGEPGESAGRMVRAAPPFTELLRTHVLAWRRQWRRGDVTVSGAPDAQRALRLHAFHLMQTASPHTAELDVGIPARGWHGEAYRGHVFWDELFAFPYLVTRFPDVARSVLLYRWRRIGEAREHARKLGHRGALFPWRSGSDGREEQPHGRVGGGPGRGRHEASPLQYHVNGAVALDAWRYHEATGDVEFMSAHGAEIVVETARFWASMATLDPDDGRYHLRGVLGPDELHDRYPDADRPGVDDDAYTNVLAAWTLGCAREALALLPADRAAELCDRLAVSDAERARWDEVGSRLALPFMDDGVLAQFAGWERLEELDLAPYRERLEAGERLGPMLEADGRSPAAYRVSGHPDTLMLFYAFAPDELRAVVERLGYAFGPDVAGRTLRHHMERTVPGSRLGEAVVAWLAARDDRAGDGGSWAAVERFLSRGLHDGERHTAADGIHLGAMAVTLDLMQRCYLGVEPSDGVVRLSPALPAAIPWMHATVRHRGQWLSVRAERDAVTVRCREGLHPTTRLEVDGHVTELAVGEERTFGTAG